MTGVLIRDNGGQKEVEYFLTADRIELTTEILNPAKCPGGIMMK